jgi:hypothetical protein
LAVVALQHPVQTRALVRREQRVDVLVQRLLVGAPRLRVGVLVCLPRLADGVADLRALCVAEVQRAQRMQVAAVVMAVMRMRRASDALRGTRRQRLRRVLRQGGRWDGEGRRQCGGRQEADR